jgi:hypothetical protein
MVLALAAGVRSERVRGADVSSCRGSLSGQWAGRGQALGQGVGKAWGWAGLGAGRGQGLGQAVGSCRGSLRSSCCGKKEQAQTVNPEAAFLHLVSETT